MYTTKVFIIALCLGFAVAHLPKGKKMQDAHINLLQFMMQMNELSKDDPARSLSCFEYYAPIFNEIVDTFEKNYAACLDKSVISKRNLDTEFQGKRTDIAKVASDACNLFVACDSLESVVKYFECYQDGGSKNTKTMYTLSNSAADYLMDYNEALHIIEVEEEQCTNEADREYVENTAKTYNDLLSCTSGETSVPESRSHSQKSVSAASLPNNHISKKNVLEH